MTTYSDLLGGTYWHAGNASVSYSFLGTPPAYYPALDVDGDGVDDARIILSTGGTPATGTPDEIVAINADVSLNAAQQAAALNAITRWNEVANFNLTQVASSGSGNGSAPTGTPVAPGNTLVSGLGGSAGYGEIEVPRNDDGFMLLDSTQVSAVFETGLNFFGATYDSFYVNTNGSISFGSGISTYTPSTITSGGTPAILPFWADVDTRSYSDGSNPPAIYVDVDPAADVITVTWPGVDYFSTTNANHAPKANWFQLQLYDRGNGDFDIVYRYQDINWSAGDASGGSQGLGGTAAHAGWTAGNGANYFELPQSGDEAAILGLESAQGNTGLPGFWVFQVRNGQVSIGDITFAAYDAYSQTGTDDLSPTIPPNGQPQTELFGFMHFPGSVGVRDFHGDMWVNNNLTYATGERPVANPVEGNEGWATFLHELGHGLGFTHPANNPYTSDNQYTVMSYNPHPSQAGASPANAVWPVTPLLLDIQAAQATYGANLNTRTGDDVYFATGGEFAIADGGSLIAAIWDAGGNDTFSAENQTAAVTIDLRPGHFSSIGAITDNIAIAQGVQGTGAMSAWIENAVGGSGNDTLQGNVLSNVLRGNAGDDTMYGDDGWDTISGGDGNDIIHGGARGDTIDGGAGDDDLQGEDGWDFVTGGPGNDVISGGTGNDNLFGNENDDVISGGDGDDRLWGGLGNDAMHGDAGNDLLIGNAGQDHFWGDEGLDTIIAGGGNDVLEGGADADRLFGNENDDVVSGGAGNDWIWGGIGNDMLHGDEGDDVIHGNRGYDTLYGDAGTDTLIAGIGNDVLHGGDGADRLFGNQQADVLDGGAGNDRLWGGLGRDFFMFSDGFGNDRIEDFTLRWDRIDLSGVSAVTDWTDLSTSHLTIGASGNVVITAGADSIELVGVTSVAHLEAGDFIF